jgi:hypothetical protein
LCRVRRRGMLTLNPINANQTHANESACAPLRLRGKGNAAIPTTSLLQEG